MAQKVVLVSGCSSGFGLLIAVQAARKGHRVFATMRNPASREALDVVAGTAKVAVEVLALDVDSQASIDSCVAQVLATAGRIDCLVNNAGFAIARLLGLGLAHSLQLAVAASGFYVRHGNSPNREQLVRFLQTL